MRNASVRLRWLRPLPAAAIVAALLTAGGAIRLNLMERPGLMAASYVGSQTCASCHPAEARLWHASQHARAMAHANGSTVLGDFNDANFDYFGTRSRFFRKDSAFFVETDGKDGKRASFQVKYTFGVDPLQQYLVEFPDGRLQALPFAWDSRPKDKGGQRWFHLYPDEPVRHNGALHWTGLYQNWNFMCAECHSTGLRKNYDARRDQFKTTWAEISVGCEACHGQGSRHVAWARARRSWWPFAGQKETDKGLIALFDERKSVSWVHDARTGSAARSAQPASLRKEVETCGLCHARRGQLSEDWLPGRPLSDTHAVSTLSQGLYAADGQMRDEVYNYGSFRQSKMYAAGVTCGDCHDPHSGKTRFSGDTVCLQCHAADKYAVPGHHRHEAANPRPGCISCHMPARTYMIIDPRHDHGFRVPRPDLSVTLGTPNACNDCHTDKTPAWAAEAVGRCYGAERKGFQRYAGAFHAAWNARPEAAGLLAALLADPAAPAFARASALAEAASMPTVTIAGQAPAALTDPDPMVRIGALGALQSLPPARAWPLASPLLADPVRGVRIRAAALLAGVPGASQTPADRAAFDRAAAEFAAAQRLNADRPEARVALGAFLAQRGQHADAAAEYQAALRLSSVFAPAAVNLADLNRQLGRDGEGERVLREALAAAPRDAALHYTLGLTLVRLKRNGEALAALQQAAALAPGQARYAYSYALGLHAAGRLGEALAVLRESHARHSNDRETLLALALFSRDAGDVNAALGYAERLARTDSRDPAVAHLLQDLRDRAVRP